MSEAGIEGARLCVRVVSPTAIVRRTAAPRNEHKPKSRNERKRGGRGSPLRLSSAWPAKPWSHESRGGARRHVTAFSRVHAGVIVEENGTELKGVGSSEEAVGEVHQPQTDACHCYSLDPDVDHRMEIKAMRGK